MMTKQARGLSDPLPPSIQRRVNCSMTAPAALGTKVNQAEPYASISAKALLHENVSHSGWIRKEGFSIRTWKNRYMILYHGCIYYFKETDSAAPKGKFALNGYRCEVAPERDKADTRYPYNFKLASANEEDRTYYFSSPSKSEMEGWIKDINDDIRTYCENDEFYDYVETSEALTTGSKYPTVARETPKLPEPRRGISHSLPNSPEKCHNLFPNKDSDYFGTNPNPTPGSPIINQRKAPLPPQRRNHTSCQSITNQDNAATDPEEMYLDLGAPGNEPILSDYFGTNPNPTPGSPIINQRKAPLPPQRRNHTSCQSITNQDNAATDPEEMYLDLGAPGNEPILSDEELHSPTRAIRMIPNPPHRGPIRCPPNTPVLKDDACSYASNNQAEQIYLVVLPNEDEAKCKENQQNSSENTTAPSWTPKRPPKPKPIPPKPIPPKPSEDNEESQYLPQQCRLPDINKNQAKVYLELGRNIGVYIIHGSQTSTSKLGLSVWMSNGIKRYLIFKEQNMFTLDPITNERFPDLCQLVKYYYTNPLPRCTQFLTAPFK